MKIGKQNKKNYNAPRGEFASVFDESPWERFTDRIKPLIKVLVVLAVIGGVGYGGFLLFGNKNHSASNAAPDSAANTQADAQKQLAQCLAGVRSSNPVPEAGDADFYKKLIGGYDQQLGCYDKYPDVDSTGRVSVEGLRTSAIDASGAYKDTYLSSNTYNYTPRTQASTSGSSTYITNTQSDTSQQQPAGVAQPTSTTTNTATPDNSAWCSTKKTEVDNLYSEYKTARDNADSLRTQLSKVAYSQPPGFSGTQSQLDAWRASETQRIQNMLTPAESAEQTAYSKYNSANSEYITKGCR